MVKAGQIGRRLGGRCVRLRAHGQSLDAIGDLLCRLTKLGHGPVGSVAFGDVIGAGMVDEPLGQRGMQHELSLGNGDETVPEAVEPELGPAGLADTGVEMMGILDMARGADPGRKHPVANTGGQVGDRGLAALENGRELPGDGKLQGHTGLRFLHAKREGFHVDPFPAEREDLVAPHSGVEPEPQGISDCLVIDFRFDPLLPAGEDLGGS